MIKPSKKLQEAFDKLTDCQQEHIARVIGHRDIPDDQSLYSPFEKGFQLGQETGDEDVWSFRLGMDAFTFITLFLIGTEDEALEKLKKLAK